MVFERITYECLQSGLGEQRILAEALAITARCSRRASRTLERDAEIITPDERPMDVDIVLQAVAKLAEYDCDGSHIIVHCLHGNNRSRTVDEAYHYAKLGTHYEDEYQGYTNHLIWNCAKGYLPPLQEMEKMLRTPSLSKNPLQRTKRT